MGNSVTPLQATETRAGYVKLATAAEVAAGSIATKAVSPARLTTFLGPYSPTRLYAINDLVIFNGGIYRCILPALGNSPPDVVYWADPTGMAVTDPVLPANATFTPASSSGTGTLADPYIISGGSTVTGGIGSTCFIMSLSGLTSGYSVPLSDNNAATNGGRFTFSNYTANASGVLVTAVLFNDSPASAPATTYTLDMRVGGTTRVTHVRTISSTPLLNPDNVVSIAVATTAVAGTSYVITSTLDLSLPSTPNDGDWVNVVERSNVTACRVLGNGKLIANELNVGVNDLNINVHVPGFRLVFDSATDMWYVTM